MRMLRRWLQMSDIWLDSLCSFTVVNNWFENENRLPGQARNTVSRTS